MRSLTPYQRLIEFQQLTESQESGSSIALREENADFGAFDQVTRALVRS